MFVGQTKKIKELENKRKVLKDEILKINSLLIDNSKEPVKHPLIEEIFSGKKGSSYFKISN